MIALPSCECKKGLRCAQCPAKPERGKLLDLCQLFTNPATGICTADDSTEAGAVLAILMPMTAAEFRASENEFKTCIASAAGLSPSNVVVLGVTAARRAGKVGGSWRQYIFETVEKVDEIRRMVTRSVSLPGFNNRRADSVAAETMVIGPMSNLLKLISSPDSLNAALVAKGLPARSVTSIRVVVYL
jgi:hypothetical protein